MPMKFRKNMQLVSVPILFGLLSLKNENTVAINFVISP